ncbi:MAG: sialidase family protein [Bryobacteraceae bacterium]
MTNRREFLHHSGGLLAATQLPGAPNEQDAVYAADFESRTVYRSARRPGYTSWVSFFPGERGQWYLTCEEVTRPEPPLPRLSPQRWHEFGLPNGYDKSPLRMEMVILESSDEMKTWRVISREPARFQHSAGQFGTARTRDGRFLRFVWAVYGLEEKPHPGEIFFTSSDNGKTWRKQPPFHGRELISHPHRLRTLKDGTLVLALPIAPAWGTGASLPVRTARNMNAAGSLQMTLCFSYDQGRTWSQPLPIYGGETVSETDFAELPSGDLLCINNSIFARPGRQVVYRKGNRWWPGAFEFLTSGRAPETVALTGEGILVGCMRSSHYYWSDDLGYTWQPLAGIPDAITRSRECYQPWIQHLGQGRFACAGHYGADDAFGSVDQSLMIHFFRLEVRRRTRGTRLELTRDFDPSRNRWKNEYSLSLTTDGNPLAGKDVEFWWVERRKPGYESFSKHTLDERIKMGGRLLNLRTAADGSAHVNLPEMDSVADPHHSYQLIARFNADKRDTEFKPAQTALFEFYANSVY